MKYEGFMSMSIKFIVDACCTTYNSHAVVCPTVGKTCIMFKWARSNQTIVKILLHLYVFLYQLVKKIFYSTLGQHFSAIKWKRLSSDTSLKRITNKKDTVLGHRPGKW